MNSSFLLGITTFTYLFSTLLYVAGAVFRTAKVWAFATIFTFCAWLIQTGGIALRWSESYQQGIGHAPLTNMYESVVFFAWMIVLIYLVIELRFKTKAIGVVALPFAFLAMAYASFSTNINKTITPLIPALQSNWLISHVITCFVGYASFAIAASLGMLYLYQYFTTPKDGGKIDTQAKAWVPSFSTMDSIIHSTMFFGFIWLSVGIVTGAIWANSAWGTYWSWDAKETWSLITWFFYAVVLHARYTKGLKGSSIAFLSIVGFVSVLFTYYGVNFLLSGLHSYGSS